MIQERPFFVCGQPLFAIFDSLLGEGHVDQISVTVGFPAKRLAVQLNRSKILLCFFCRGCTETFVVFDGPAFTVVVGELPVYDGKTYGLRSSMMGDRFYVEGGEAYECAMIGFEVLPTYEDVA